MEHCTKTDKIDSMERAIDTLTRTLYGNGQKGMKQMVTDTAKDVSYMSHKVDAVGQKLNWFIGIAVSILLVLAKIAFL
jgi:hypothetical protein